MGRKTRMEALPRLNLGGTSMWGGVAKLLIPIQERGKEGTEACVHLEMHMYEVSMPFSWHGDSCSRISTCLLVRKMQ